MSVTRTAYSSSCNFFGKAAPAELVKEFGSPLYVYNEAVLRSRCRDMKKLADAIPGLSVCYSTKANGNPHLLRIVREEGLMADAMSPGELALLHKAGFTRERINFVCNNVAPEELRLASQEAHHVSVDSLAQLELFGQVNPGASVMVRLNPGIGAGHHDKVITAGKKTKFGVNPEDFGVMREILTRYDLQLIGLNQHVGSLFMEAGAYLDAAAWLLEVAKEFPSISVIDFGGGFGIPYHKYDAEKALDIADFQTRFADLLQAYRTQTGYAGEFVIEPGRYIAAECSILLGSVYAVKNNGPTRYVGTDIGFTILARPMMYDSFHDVEVYPGNAETRNAMAQTIVGNICESGDILANDREIPELMVGDTVGILDAGAYGHAMSSNYTQRLRPAEVLITVDGGTKLIRKRDTIDELLAHYPE